MAKRKNWETQDAAEVTPQVESTPEPTPEVVEGILPENGVSEMNTSTVAELVAAQADMPMKYPPVRSGWEREARPPLWDRTFVAAIHGLSSSYGGTGRKTPQELVETAAAIADAANELMDDRDAD